MFTKVVVFLIAYCVMYLLFKILDSKYPIDKSLHLSDVIGKWKYIFVFFMTVFYQLTIFLMIILCVAITYKHFKILNDAKKWS